MCVLSVGYAHPLAARADAAATPHRSPSVQISLPAQSFHTLLDSLIPILSTYPRVIYHCQTSKGRGTRVASWYQDALDEREIGKEVSRAGALGSGVVGWESTGRTPRLRRSCRCPRQRRRYEGGRVLA